MAKTKDKRFKDLSRSIDLTTLQKLNVSQRMSMLDSVEGRNLLASSNFTAQQLADSFPYNDQKTKTKLQSIMTGNYNVKATDDKSENMSVDVTKKLESDGYKGRGRSRSSDPGAVAQLTREQKEVFDLLKKDQISMDDPRAAFLKDISDSDLKKFGIQRVDTEEGKRSYKMTEPDITEEQIKMRLAGQDSSGLRNRSGRVISTAETNMTPQERALLDTIASGESPDYNTITSGGGRFDNYTDHPRRRVGSVNSDAAGRYQFLSSTWDGVVKEYNRKNPNDPITDFSPRNQDRAALYLAQRDYSRRTGRDLMTDLNDPNADVGSLLQKGLGGQGNNTTWQAFQGQNREHWSRQYSQNLGRNRDYLSTAQAREDTPEMRAKAAEELKTSVYGQREAALSGYLSNRGGLAVNQAQRSTPPGQESRKAVIAMGSNDYSDPRNVYANTMDQIRKAKAAGLDPVIISPNPNGKTSAAAAEVARAAQEAGARLEVPQSYVRDGVHPTAGEYKRLGEQYRGSVFSGDSIAVGIGRASGLKTESDVDESGKPTVYLKDENGKRVARQGANTSEINSRYGDFVPPVPQAQAQAQTEEQAVPSMPDGGEMNTDADQLEVYKLDKNKLQRDDMIATDGEGKPQFTMNSKEEMKFDPNTGNVEVNSGAKGYRNEPMQLGPVPEPAKPVEPTKTETEQKNEKESEKISNRPAMPLSPVSTEGGANAADMSLGLTENVMKSPSFERAMARARFTNTGDAALGGNFDFGATNMI